MPYSQSYFQSYFQWNERLGVHLPAFLETDFDHFSLSEQTQILAEWQQIEARFPDEIMRMEAKIEERLTAIHEEEDWDIIVSHFEYISDCASKIHELNLWQRLNPTLTRKWHE